MRVHLGDGRCVSGFEAAQQLFRLALQLIEVGTLGKGADGWLRPGHDELLSGRRVPSVRPVSAHSGRKEFIEGDRL
jgi:hypothetical protein